MQPLADIKVLDLTWHVAGPYCTKLLADYGADVIKVERPQTGDPARAYGPFPKDRPHLERSGTFLHLNTNKRSVTVNLRDQAGKGIVRELARWADVVVENFAPGTLTSLGMDYAALRKINPALVMCSISNFGQTGPYRDYKATDFIVSSMAGFVYTQGIQQREPLKSPDHLQEYQSGAHGAMAIMGAVMHRLNGGAGQYIDIGIYEVGSDSADRRSTQLSGYEYTGLISNRRDPVAGVLPGGKEPTSDGFVEMMVSPAARWPRLMQMLGRQDLVEELKLRDQRFWTRPEARKLVDSLLDPWLKERTKQEVFIEAQAAKIAAAPVNTLTEVLHEPHLRARGYFVEAEHPSAGLLPYTGPSFHKESEGWALKATAPLLGQHNRDILSGYLGFAPAELRLLRETGAI